jgi:hypothetical protein
MLLLSFLQSIHLFSDREIENLFLASYLKDIGFAMIPSEKYDLNTLSKKLGIGLRTITSMAKSYNLPHRDKLIMYVYAPNQKSTQVRTKV